MKTRSGKPHGFYDISDTIWSLPDGCVAWVLYNPKTLEPTGYRLLGSPLPPLDQFAQSKKRPGFRRVNIRQANHRVIEMSDLATLLFDQIPEMVQG
jgi:hypothetical protein